MAGWSKSKGARKVYNRLKKYGIDDNAIAERMMVGGWGGYLPLIRQRIMKKIYRNRLTNKS